MGFVVPLFTFALLHSCDILAFFATLFLSNAARFALLSLPPLCCAAFQAFTLLNPGLPPYPQTHALLPHNFRFEIPSPTKPPPQSLNSILQMDPITKSLKRLAHHQATHLIAHIVRHDLPTTLDHVCGTEPSVPVPLHAALQAL